MNAFLVRNVNNIIKYTMIISCVYLFIVIAIYVWFFHDEEVSKLASAWGTFGDFIGGTLNPIFSLLALFSLLATIALQSHEMELTREELKRAASAQERTEQELAEQAKILRNQKFEDTFFSLINQLNSVFDKLSNNNHEETSIEKLSGTFIGRGTGDYNKSTQIAPLAKKHLLQENQILNQYFRILYQILKFICINCEETGLKKSFSSENITLMPASEKELFYSNIVRSFLIEDLYYLLAINCYAVHESDQFMTYRRLIERYKFLEHINLSIRLDENEMKMININLIDDLVSHYDASAFGKNEFLGKVKEKSIETEHIRQWFYDWEKGKQESITGQST